VSGAKRSAVTSANRTSHALWTTLSRVLRRCSAERMYSLPRDGQDYLVRQTGKRARRFRPYYSHKTELLKDWLRGAKRAMCVCHRGSNSAPQGGPHMSFEAELVAASRTGKRS